MSRLKNLFDSNKQHILNIYVTAGYPALNSTRGIMKALEENGADIIELGMPYSDPLADGPVIQESSAIALSNGMTIKELFSQLTGFRNEIQIPVILMGYMNPVMQYGFEKFCEQAVAAGIDGLIIPDLPAHEYETMYMPVVKKYGLDFIFLVTPETSVERIEKLDQLSSGFLYAVSSSSTTGSGNKKSDLDSYLVRLGDLHLQNPVLVGFGIANQADFKAVCQQARGGIIGSAFIKALKDSQDVKATTKSFLSSILGIARF